MVSTIPSSLQMGVTLPLVSDNRCHCDNQRPVPLLHCSVRCTPRTSTLTCHSPSISDAVFISDHLPPPLLVDSQPASLTRERLFPESQHCFKTISDKGTGDRSHCHNVPRTVHSPCDTQHTSCCAWHAPYFTCHKIRTRPFRTPSACSHQHVYSTVHSLVHKKTHLHSPHTCTQRFRACSSSVRAASLSYIPPALPPTPHHNICTPQHQFCNSAVRQGEADIAAITAFTQHSVHARSAV
jgi:hypothetical protein